MKFDADEVLAEIERHTREHGTRSILRHMRAWFREQSAPHAWRPSSYHRGCEWRIDECGRLETRQAG